MEKDPHKSEVQSEIERTKVEENLYVNAATLELFQRRLEAGIKNSFWRWLGLPIGGVSVLAFVGFIWALPGYVDKHVGTIISNLPQFQQTVQTQTQSYLRDEEKGARLIERFVANIAPPYIDNVVTNHLKGPEGANRIKTLVLDYMKSERGREQITTAIDQAVQPLRADLGSKLSEKLSMYLQEVEKPLIFPEGSPDIVKKGTLHELEMFLARSAQQMKERGRPFVLTISRTNNHWYERSAIHTYVQELRRVFQAQFKVVLIEGEQQELLGLIPLSEFEQVIGNEKRADLFMRWLNRQSSGQLTQWFDPKVTKYASTAERMIKLLSAKESWHNRAANEPIAVLDSAGKFLGITNRNTILNQLVVSVLRSVG